MPESSVHRSADRLLELSGTLEEHRGFAEVIASLQSGHGATVGGTWGSSSALVAASLEKACPADGMLVVLTAHADDAERLLDDLSIFSKAAAELLSVPDRVRGESLAIDQAIAERLGLVKRLIAGNGPRILVTCAHALLIPLADPRDILEGTRTLRIGDRLESSELTSWLVARGWEPTATVETPGTLARRGGIFDLFAPDWDRPIRIELDGDEIESIRSFDQVSQRSISTLDFIELTALGNDSSQRRTTLAELISKKSWWGIVEPAEVTEEARKIYQRLSGITEVTDPEDIFSGIWKFPSVTLSSIASSSLEASAELSLESIERFSGSIDRVRGELYSIGRDQEVWIIAETSAEIDRLTELLSDCAPARSGKLNFALGKLTAGFRIVPKRIVLVSASELFHRETLGRRSARRSLVRAIDTFLDLHEGDYVVHVAHGIGRYRGLKLLEQHGRTEEFLEIEFALSTIVFVPASGIEMVQKYVGGNKNAPRLAKIGSTLWEKQKQSVREAVADMASEMLSLQARRDNRPGISFPPDTPWQQKFEESFPFEETPDQVTASAAIKADMQQPRPMDRLLCGDVGFGKTEMAMRAAFKAVEAGFQAAVLVPTTVLADQHRRSFIKRFAEFPFVVASLSRFSSPSEERETLEGLASGKIDIVIGTHRLVQKDIHFSNLGIIVIDEEQRFGVEIKERLKALRASVDVLTMTATPIPRTLHMSMLGIRDISNLATPPMDRIAVETRVARWDEALIRQAIDRELARNGQVFFIHNRIHDIHLVKHKLERIAPEATIGIVHGRLSEDNLEHVMLDFVAGNIDILLATTIVESGLDIPRANTIFIDEADHYGLADLHQLRGRVGRSHHRAYCYMLIDSGTHLSGTAARRLRAIQEFSSMGAGFSLAMRDLEIRGAGNLLGTQQSGHIAMVGYELYCRLLEQAVRRLKALPPSEPPTVQIDLPGDAWLPREYISDFRSKIDLYRRIARATLDSQLDEISTELTDRFGPPPETAQRLIERGRLRIAASLWSIHSIGCQDGLIMIRYRDPLPLERLRRERGSRLRIIDGRSACLPLDSRVQETPNRIWDVVKTLLRPRENLPYSPPPSVPARRS